ncbi:lipoprotein [Piscinibacter sp. XHJ-5]|uniref:LPS translocon maturation chaperone LptM n=1 Tax=Piscinibacter sp. XHJ-5 TaxID=3037797 RepID=UPI00329A7339
MPKRHSSLARRSVVMTAAGSLLAALSLLSACGQKGPLTLATPKPPPVPAAAPASSPSSAP